MKSTNYTNESKVVKQPLTQEEKRIRNRAYSRRARAVVKLAVIKAYGGRCACCGISNHEFLTIDHIEGGGLDHRKQLANGTSIAASTAVYRWLRKMGWPTNFQLLCFNCNCAKYYSGGCPHQKDKP